MDEPEKRAVYDFWNETSCGEALYLSEVSKDGYRAQAEERYFLEPYIHEFAQFRAWKGKRVLEIGVGLGADHQMFAEAGAICCGIDLTDRSIAHTKRRFQIFSLASDLRVSDAEDLPYLDNEFDLVYSWGVLHHTPGTQKAIDEVHRVLKQDGTAKIMLYHKYSIVGYMLWFRFAFLHLKPMTPLSKVYSRHLESPGTRAFSIREASRMFSKFRDKNMRTVLSHGDLLSSFAGQRHQGALLSTARALWPRRFIRLFLKKHGLFLLISGIK